jgi:Na+-transporting methylmalonyl-CoA/oxaloacetate decarboxylase gamma subunit
MDSLDALESSLSWSEFWATAACFAVAVGLVLEYHEQIREAILKRSFGVLPLGALLVTLGVAFEFVFQARTSILVSEVRGIQQKQASDSNERVSNAEKSAAEARERAAKAELALSKMNAPRVINGPDFTKLMNLLRLHSGKTFWVIVERNEPDTAGEQQDLGNQIERLFTAAGWKKDSHWSQLDEAKVDPDHAPVGDRGCQLAFSTRSVALGNLVLNGLRDAEIECASFAGEEVKPDHVIVTIGLR